MYALPVTVASMPIGALEMYRHRSGPLGSQSLTGGLWAAGLAAAAGPSDVDVDWQAAGDKSEAFDQLHRWSASRSTRRPG